ncbi:hypothetical protein [Aquabacterium sp.]|uniref:hypothetical protein n=1 Tax=Aquabacterium sp. TaxID=1872578 RepID=UPI002CE339ED|nr:hypothetical protein [Aquabacterium sp.]HSW05571.1 hypothetical protein [Aquabacterium sp.]
MDTEPLRWDDEQLLLGVRVRAHFFDPDAVAGQDDWVARLLPVLPHPGHASPKSLHHDGERGSYVVGDLLACPDAVFEHGNGLICLTHRNADKLSHDPQRWPRQLRIDAMLQSIVSAMAVSGQRQQPTAALLRCHNVLYQFDPSPPVLECLATHIGAAKRYCGEPAQISVQQLAAYCEPRLRALPAPPGSDAPPDQCDIAFADTTPSAAAMHDA